MNTPPKTAKTRQPKTAKARPSPKSKARATKPTKAVQGSANPLQQRLAAFLIKRRKEDPSAKTYAAFSKKIGLSVTSLYLLENSRLNLRLTRLGQITERLGCKLSDIFND